MFLLLLREPSSNFVPLTYCWTGCCKHWAKHVFCWLVSGLLSFLIFLQYTVPCCCFYNYINFPIVRSFLLLFVVVVLLQLLLLHPRQPGRDKRKIICSPSPGFLTSAKLQGLATLVWVSGWLAVNQLRTSSHHLPLAASRRGKARLFYIKTLSLLSHNRCCVVGLCCNVFLLGRNNGPNPRWLCCFCFAEEPKLFPPSFHPLAAQQQATRSPPSLKAAMQ